ncbi:MAG: hypothetical protein ACE5I8_11345 [Thermodesulfobacteriota bacterium]
MEKGLMFLYLLRIRGKGLSPNPKYGNEREIRFLQDETLEPEEERQRERPLR